LRTLTLRTPLGPVKTFMDDPLRVLRMLRFYSRFEGSNLDPAAVEAMKLASVHDALRSKVSAERILTEWKKIFAGRQITKALRVLYETGIWDAVFVTADIKDYHPFNMDQKNRWHVDPVFDHTLKVVDNYDAILRADGCPDDERALCNMAAFKHDLGKLDRKIIGSKETPDGVFNSYHGHEDSSAFAVRSILGSLKASTDDTEFVAKIAQYHMIPHQDVSDKHLRKLIRETGRSMARRVVQHALADATSKPGGDVVHYTKMLERVATLDTSPPKKPPLPGGVLMERFATLLPESGFIKEVNAKLQELLDEDPATTQDQLLAEVERMRQEIESKFGGYVKKAKKGSWYQDNVKVARDTVDWLCGDVVKKPFAKDGDREVVMLVVDTGEYVLRRSQAEDGRHDPELEKLVGRSICAKGMIHGYTFIVSEWTHQHDREQEGVTYMERNAPKDLTKFEVGDRVRRRNFKGLAFEQIDGRVSRIEGDLMYIKWDGVNEQEVFKLTDTVSLHGLVEKI
jgi:hypothetical protein